MKWPGGHGAKIGGPQQPRQRRGTDTYKQRTPSPTSGVPCKQATGPSCFSKIALVIIIIIILLINFMSHIRCARPSARSFISIYTVEPNTTTAGGGNPKHPQLTEEGEGAERLSHGTGPTGASGAPPGLLDSRPHASSPWALPPSEPQFPHMYRQSWGTGVGVGAFCPAQLLGTNGALT